VTSRRTAARRFLYQPEIDRYILILKFYVLHDISSNLFQVTESIRVAISMTPFIYMPSEVKFDHDNVQTGYKLGCGCDIFSYGIAGIFF
jgi:hypothetical protein